MEKESYDIRIKKLEKAIKEARDDRAQAVARREVLERDLDNLNQRIIELGCQPEELEQRIKEIRSQIDGLMKNIEGLLPAHYLEKAGW